jgi:hypothetical protein
MIEVASHPGDLAKWDPGEDPFYFEVYGETQPVLDMTYAEVVPAGEDSAATVTSTPVYEYWWTLGHAGTAPEHHHLWPERKADKPVWEKLHDTAAHIYLYFPIDAGWRIKELVATVKYLSPVADQKTWSEEAAAEWTKLQPILDGASSLASTLAPVPGVGAVAAGAAPILSTLAKLQIGSVPQGVKGFEWSVGMVTFASKQEHGVMQGVLWTLPKQMFELLGGRLTGSLAVSFIPTRVQRDDQGAWLPQAASMLGHAAIYADDGTKWVPGSGSFVSLRLKPRLPDPKPAASSQPGQPGKGQSV